MSKKHSSNHVGNLNETTATALTTQINGFVHEGTLDSRCAAKLVKHPKKEAEAISETGNATKSCLLHRGPKAFLSASNFASPALLQQNR